MMKTKNFKPIALALCILLLALCTVAVLAATVAAAEATDGEPQALYIGGQTVSITKSMAPVYALTDQNGVVSFDGANAENYCIKIEADAQRNPTVTLRSAFIRVLEDDLEVDHAIYYEGSETLTVYADLASGREDSRNRILSQSGAAICAQSLILKGTIYSITSNSGTAIEAASGNVIVSQDCNISAINAGVDGIYAQQSVEIDGNITIITAGGVGILAEQGSVTVNGAINRINASEDCGIRVGKDVNIFGFVGQSIKSRSASAIYAEGDILIAAKKPFTVKGTDGIVSSGKITVKSPLDIVATERAAEGEKIVLDGVRINTPTGAEIGSLNSSQETPKIFVDAFGEEIATVSLIADDGTAEAIAVVKVGGVTLTATESAPAYALTDADGAVTVEGADGNHYHVKLTVDGNGNPTVSLNNAYICYDGDAIYQYKGDILTVHGEAGTNTLASTNGTIYALKSDIVLSGRIDGITSTDLIGVRAEKGNVTITGTVGEISGKYSGIYAYSDITVAGGAKVASITSDIIEAVRSGSGGILTVRGEMTAESIEAGTIDLGEDTWYYWTDAQDKALIASTAQRYDITQRGYLKVVPFTYRISFDAGEGSGTMAALENIPHWTAYALPQSTFVAPAGTHFKGWALTPGGTVLEGKTHTVVEDTTLYAIWEEHSATPLCTEAAYCTCGALVAEATGHDYVGAVTTQPTCTEKGVKTFTCTHDSIHTYTEEMEALGHTYDNDCDAACNVCSAERTVAAHLDADGNKSCDTCGAFVEKKGLSGGAIAGIVIGAVALLCGGGFCVYWFVIRKKKQAS